MSVGLRGSGLDGTVTARWRRRLAGTNPEEKRHWRTKTAYYAAVSRLLAAGTPQLGWSEVALAVEPRGSRSTFYEVTGAHAKHPLINDLIVDDNLDALQLALYYRRSCAIDQLIDETKVWTYWPHRECLSLRCRIEDLDASASVDLLLSTVAEWARRNAGVASALDYAPPLCAVEDLLVIRPGQFSAVHAVGTLTRTVREALCG
ncbi:hypothetical protein [Phytohabitans rumicis]|uniref:hypothetical protein n=1 Tax=Phytohabitans rumicis TaxID=1076125 RepID=UPI0015668842|nr:hypothetical protein [Phytohabitans rumicis]